MINNPTAYLCRHKPTGHIFKSLAPTSKISGGQMKLLSCRNSLINFVYFTSISDFHNIVLMALFPWHTKNNSFRP